jgi:hypothetical protein
MRYFVSPVRARPLEVNPIVAQLVEQVTAHIDRSP